MGDDDKITIEIKITIPAIGKNLGKTIEHVLNATEEIVRAGKSVVVKKVEIK